MDQTDPTPAMERRMLRKRADKIQRVSDAISEFLLELPVTDRVVVLHEVSAIVLRAVRTQGALVTSLASR
jgi:hypothetical protein